MGSVGEHTHSGRALKLSWNSRVWFAKNFESVSAAARGNIGEEDGLVPGQEYNKGKEAANRGGAEAATTQLSREPSRGSAEASGATQGDGGPKRATQRQQEARRVDAGPARAAQGQRNSVWGDAGPS